MRGRRPPVASPGAKISATSAHSRGVRAYRGTPARRIPYPKLARERTLAEAALGAEVAGATCIMLKLAQRDCIVVVAAISRASRYGPRAGDRRRAESSIHTRLKTG